MSYGVFLSFRDRENFLAAYQALKQTVWKCETFTPYAVDETMPPEKSPIQNVVKVAGLIGAVTGMFTGFFMQWYADVIESPIDVGGRPLNSWPAFIPVTWVLTVLFAGVAVFFSLWWKLGLPKPYRRVFNAKNFQLGPHHFGILIRFVPGHEVLPSETYLKSLHADSWEQIL